MTMNKTPGQCHRHRRHSDPSVSLSLSLTPTVTIDYDGAGGAQIALPYTANHQHVKCVQTKCLKRVFEVR